MRVRGLFNCTIIPDNIKEELPDLKSQTRFLYAYVSRFLDDNDVCTISNGHIAEMLGLSKRTVIRQMNELVEKGYVKKKK